MIRKCFCGAPGLISRERLAQGSWVCIIHATEDARKDAEHRPIVYVNQKVTDFFLKKMRTMTA